MILFKPNLKRMRAELDILGLMKVLQCSNKEMRKAAVVALSEGNEEIHTLIKDWNRVKHTKSARKIVKQARLISRRIKEHEDSSKKSRKELLDYESTDPLVTLLACDDHSVRKAIANAILDAADLLARHFGEPALGLITHALVVEDSTLYKTAIQAIESTRTALGRAELPRFIYKEEMKRINDLVDRILISQDGEVRKKALDVVISGSLKDGRTRRVLVDALSDKQLQKCAVQRLKKATQWEILLGPNYSLFITPLVRMLGDECEELQKEAGEALTRPKTSEFSQDSTQWSR